MRHLHNCPECCQLFKCTESCEPPTRTETFNNKEIPVSDRLCDECHWLAAWRFVSSLSRIMRRITELLAYGDMRAEKALLDAADAIASRQFEDGLFPPEAMARFFLRDRAKKQGT